MSDYALAIKQIRDKSKSFFGSNLLCILHLGSSIKKFKKPNDLDIVIILNNREQLSDIQGIKDAIKDTPYPLDIQIISLPGMEGWSFSHFTHGQFFVYFLRAAKTIYGSNPFKGIYVSDNYILSSVIQKSQYYYIRAQRSYFLKNTSTSQSLTEKEFLFHRKKILFILADYWLALTHKVVDASKPSVRKKILKSLCLETQFVAEEGFFNEPYARTSFNRILDLYLQINSAIVDRLSAEAKRRKLVG